MASPRRRRKPLVTVGQDITCPGGIAPGGTIRIRSERAAEVARWFGLGSESGRRGGVLGKDDRPTFRGVGESALGPNSQRRAPILELAGGTITLITGPSGAGKSSLLRAARGDERHRGRPWIDLAALAEPDLPLVDCFGGEHETPLKESLGLLARAGLGEAWTWLRTPAELSDGQRWRFRLALALHEARRRANERPLIVCDEFAALLDRVTAMIVAHRLRRSIDALPHAAALVATSHDDLAGPLSPEVLVRCDFGKFETADERG